VYYTLSEEEILLALQRKFKKAEERRVEKGDKKGSSQFVKRISARGIRKPQWLHDEGEKIRREGRVSVVGLVYGERMERRGGGQSKHLLVSGGTKGRLQKKEGGKREKRERRKG